MRRAASPIIATLALFVVGFFIGGALLYSDTAGSSQPAVYQLEFVALYKATPVSVDNSGWQLVLLIKNSGNRDNRLNMIYINNEPVDEFGLIHGDSLSNRSIIGTSIPVDGLELAPGRTETVYVWIGGDLFSKNTMLTVTLQKPNQLELQKLVTLH